MTAEMVVMNRSAVALAADSAVTISGPTPDGGQIQKIYANANKVFELIRGRPVGIMIYNSADLVQVPWETLVKIYRNQRPEASFDTLKAYLEDFVEFLHENCAELIPESARRIFNQIAVANLANSIVEAAEHRAHEAVTEGEWPRLNAELRKKMLTDVLQEIEDGATSTPVAGWAADLDEDALVKRYGSDLIKSVPGRIQGSPLTKTIRIRVLKAALSFILRNSETPSVTGIVIAGFGATEVFPSCLHLKVGGIFADRLVVSDIEVYEVTAEQPSIIRPFAQTSEATTFLFGIDPAMKREIEIWWGEWLNERLGPAAERIVQREIPGLDKAKLEEVSKTFSRFGRASWTLFARFMNELHSNLRYGPIETSAAFLSKGEIAGLAENMVNLATLRNRVSIDRDETVGGATDVAVISPGDGFVWIKRKHYFNLETNPTWASRQWAAGVVSSYGPPSEGTSDGSA
ncbi:hypothetical protein [Micromonospora gifhornensis]|uniref:hypothetical protein n=1 Tax=Micromonospora gifhornensis TaxID=84594 RepID=UPI003D70C75A